MTRTLALSLALVMPLLLLACAERAPESETQTADATRSSVSESGVDDFDAPLPGDAAHATRVVSLNPAFTEIAFALGAGPQMVGRTTWDNRPAAALAVTDVGAGIRPNVEAVLATRPTLVLMYATAENRAAAVAFARAGVRTIALRTITIADFQRAALVLGDALGHTNAARALVDSVEHTLNAVRQAVQGAERPRVVWPSWDSPVLVVGHASYEAELLELAGAINVFDDREESVANVTIEEIAKRDPDLVLGGPERIARLQASQPWNAVRAIRERGTIVLDTNVVGRPGVTIGMAAVSIARLLHPSRVDRLP